MDYIALFGRGSLTDTSNLLSTALGSTAQRMAQQLQAWDPDDLLNTSDEDVIERLAQLGSVHCPRLLTEQAEQLPSTEINQQYAEFGQRHTRRVTRFVLAVPYEGETEIFNLRADTSSTNPPRVLGPLNDRELHLAIDDPPNDGDQVTRMFNEQTAKIEQYLDWSRQQIDRHNQQIRNDAPNMVAERRAQLQATRKLQEDTGYPIRGQDTDSHSS